VEREKVSEAIETLRSQGEKPSSRKIAALIGGRMADIVHHVRDILGSSMAEDDAPAPGTTRQLVADAVSRLKEWGVEPSIEKICILTNLPAEEVTPYLESLLTGQPTQAERQADDALQAQFIDDLRQYQDAVATVRVLVESWR
jgi:hypothetical protein